jgi:hypothetical protein
MLWGAQERRHINVKEMPTTLIPTEDEEAALEVVEAGPDNVEVDAVDVQIEVPASQVSIRLLGPMHKLAENQWL